MVRSVSGLFATREQVDSAEGGLRDAGFEPERITVVGPDGQVVRLAGQVEGPRGLGAWLVEHLVRHGHPQATAQAYHDSIAQLGRWLVSAAIRTESEDADARNLLVRAGAQEISSVADGSMVAVERLGKEVTGLSPG
jgi:hypothetical protein